jgi:ectoine hydroxylase-related dioxygenase (phytanoyl-CoA dioxygenase family)
METAEIERPSDSTGPPILSQDDIAIFRKNGYVVARNITTPADLDALRVVYERMFYNKTGLADGNFFDLVSADRDAKVLPQMTDMVRYEPNLRDTLLWRNVGFVARQLIGPTADYVYDHGIRKPPKGPATPWHQDYAYYDIFTRYRSLTFWAPLHDATIENGCMWFVPGSHLGPVLPHQPLDKDPRIHAIEIVDPAAYKEAVPCPINAGDCTIHHPLTIHGTGPNLTGEPRLAYAVAFGIITKRSLIRREFSWNARKETERRRRQFESLSTLGKIKHLTKIGLVRVGLC